MADSSPLGLTTTSDVQNSKMQNNEQSSGVKDSQNADTKNQVDTANFNRSPNNNLKSAEVLTITEGSVNANVKRFNYRGTTDRNQFEPNKLIANQEDLTVSGLIDYLKGTSLELRPIDFVYLKNLGVYSNNRMIVARRFWGPITDNLYATTGKPMSTIISYIDPEDEFIKMSFNEVWEEHTDNIQKIFQDILENDFGLDLGDAIPLPGWSTGLQFAFLKALGVTNAGANNLPEGNPNLIMETRRRKVPGDNGSGLATDLQITMIVEYELKYIPGIDPSAAFNDLISNLLHMGTSNSEFYLTGSAGDKLKEYVKRIREASNKTGQESIDAYVGLITDIIKNIVDSIQNVISQVGSFISGGSDNGGTGTDPSQSKDATQTANITTNALNSLVNAGTGILNLVAQGVISKYKEKIYASINAMTGSANAPWHIMIGNPKKPIFISGDMVCEKVELELGKELGFNDLPTEIKATLTFSPARPWGAQEIASKFNSAKGRTYDATNDELGIIGENTNPNTTSNVQTSQNATNKANPNTNGTNRNGIAGTGNTGVINF
jgi:hypothetical protein